MDDLRLHGLIGGGGSNIKSIQRGVATTSGNITISTVDKNKSIIIISVKPKGSRSENTLTHARIINNTTINISSYNTADFEVYWQVIEFNNVKSRQEGLNSLVTGGSLTIDIAITPVNLAKSIIVSSYQGYGNEQINRIVASAHLSNNSTVTVGRYDNGFGNVNIAWQVIEFN